MSHGIEMDDLMISAGGQSEAPWHSFSTGDRTRIHEGQYITSEEIMDLAGLEWSVGAYPMYAKIGDGWSEDDFIVATDHLATVREDTKKFLGVVSPDFKLVQNRMLKRQLEWIVGEADAHFITAGSLRGNRVIWFLIEMPQEVTIEGMPSERSKLYMLATTSHGGVFGRDLQSTKFLPTYVRVVCNNTLTWAISGARSVYAIPHIGDVEFKLDQAREAIGLSLRFNDAMQAMANKLIQVRYTSETLDTFLDRLLPVPTSAPPEVIAKSTASANRKKRDILTTLTMREDLEPIRETNWGLLQAVSAYEGHDRRFGSPERRFETTMGLSTTESLTTKAAGILTSRGFLSAKAEKDIREALDAATADTSL